MSEFPTVGVEEEFLLVDPAASVVAQGFWFTGYTGGQSTLDSVVGLGLR
ncbi:MAG: hypothetical protein QOG14_3731 [Mycobacterium sp.]|jgi:hypothetical protein|nr:hypothetical protein [Mycobacterium sp.]